MSCMISSHSESPNILVFAGSSRNSKGVAPSNGVKWVSVGIRVSCRFSTFRPPYLRNCARGARLLLITNRNLEVAWKPVVSLHYHAPYITFAPPHTRPKITQSTPRAQTSANRYIMAKLLRFDLELWPSPLKTVKFGTDLCWTFVPNRTCI